MKPVVLEGQRSSGRAPDEQTAWSMGFFCGLIIFAVGALDTALLFYPADWASLDWEFGTVSGMIEGMPLMTLGFGAMVAASAANGWNRWRRVLSIVSLLMALLVLVLLTIYALDLPGLFRALQPAAKSLAKKSVAKTVMMAGMYIVFYATLGVWTWRRLKSLKGAS